MLSILNAVGTFLETKGKCPYLLILRVSLALVFVPTGWGKLHNLEKVIEFFGSLGIPMPQIQAPFVAGLEFVGGLLILAGLGSRVFSVLLSFTMVVAIATAKWADFGSWIELFGSEEYLLFLGLWCIVIFGPGQLSLEYLFFKKKSFL